MRRKILWLLTLLALVFLPQKATPVPSIPAFEITGSITMYHFESVVAGQKPFTNKLGAATLAACITGTGFNCNSTFLETDGGGKAYIFLETTHKAWIATNTTCANPTEMDGLVGGDGSFMFAGHHDKSGTDFVVQGKISFIKGTFTPIAIKKASIMAVSEPLVHYSIGTFATVGPLFPVAAGSCT